VVRPVNLITRKMEAGKKKYKRSNTANAVLVLEMKERQFLKKGEKNRRGKEDDDLLSRGGGRRKMSPRLWCSKKWFFFPAKERKPSTGERHKKEGRGEMPHVKPDLAARKGGGAAPTNRCSEKKENKLLLQGSKRSPNRSPEKRKPESEGAAIPWNQRLRLQERAEGGKNVFKKLKEAGLISGKEKTGKPFEGTPIRQTTRPG